MSVPLTGPGGLFTRLGRLMKALELVNAARGTDLPAAVDNLRAEFDGGDQDTVDNLYSTLRGYQAGGSGFLNSLRTLAQSIVVDMVNDDVLQPDRSLRTALVALIAQMKADGDSVQANAVGASLATASGNSGTPRIVVSTSTNLGNPQAGLFAEDVAITCTTDAQSGTVTEGQEVLRAAGQQSISDPLSWQWPAGSGSSASLVAIDPLTQDQQANAGNMLRNSSFESWSGSPATPDGWSVVGGTAGTDILESLGVYYDGAACLSFSGDGSTNSALAQTFGSDTRASLAPATVYHMNCFVKVDATPAAGVLEFALVDGLGNVVADAAGNPSSVSRDLTGIPSTFVATFATFRTPSVLPPTLRLRIRLSTPLTSGRTAYVDKLSLARPTQLYQQGLYLSAHASNSPLIVGDSFTVSASNDRAGRILTWCERLFGLRNLSLLLPSSGSPTISDSLIA